MPKGLVKTKKDEELWKKAKQIVKKQYKLTEDSEKFWRLVVAIYERMKGYKSKKLGKVKSHLKKLKGGKK